MEHRAPDNNDAPPELFADAEELTAAAREYFATDFPNPERAGCPAPGAWQRLVRAEQMPATELRAHLFGCSECFNEYRAAVAAQRRLPAAIGSPPRWRQLFIRWRPRLPVLAGGLAVLLAAVGALSWRQLQHAPRPGAQDRPQQATPNRSLSTGVEQSGGSLAAAQPTPPAPAPPLSSVNRDLLAINTDLNDYLPLGAQRRDAANDQSTALIRLPARRLRWLLRLDDDSPAGLYTISLIDARGRRFTATKRSRGGRPMSVTFDLRAAATGRAQLQIARSPRSDVAPNVYQCEIVVP